MEKIIEVKNAQGKSACARCGKGFGESTKHIVVDGFQYNVECGQKMLELKASTGLSGEALQTEGKSQYRKMMAEKTVAGMKKRFPGFETSAEKLDRLQKLASAKKPVK
jgi:hypothetical protein